MDLRPLPLRLFLEVGARPLQGSMRNAFPGLNKRTESGLRTHGVALTRYVHISIEGRRQYPMLFL